MAQTPDDPCFAWVGPNCSGKAANAKVLFVNLMFTDTIITAWWLKHNRPNVLDGAVQMISTCREAHAIYAITLY